MPNSGTPESKTNSNGRQPTKELSTGLWLLKHTQAIVTTATAISILNLRTCHVLYFTVGSLATSFTAKGLKKMIKQPRPPGSRVKKSSGMPSTHSATISFMGAYILLSSLYLPLHPSLSLGSGSSTLQASAVLDSMTRIWIGLVGVVVPVLVMWSRVRLGVHTPAQTLAGSALGVANACFWFTAWNGVQWLFSDNSTLNRNRVASTSILRDGLKHTLGVRVDVLITHTEALLARATGW